ncbi:MAG TPA: TPM domain-containing protein, partial [Verrucomicrobiae bacterium]
MQIDKTLQDFEAQTSSQILVAIFPKLPPNETLEEYTVKVAMAWKPGLKKTDNGAIFFVFVQEHLMRVEVGYGLEGPLPDALARRIMDEQVRPRFRSGDFDGGVVAGVHGILQATRGEYKGSGKTLGGRKQPGINIVFWVFFILLILFV